MSLTFHSGTVFSWWELNEVCSDTDSPFLYSLPFQDSLDHQTGNCPYITIYMFNDKEFSSFLKFISRSGIIGLYITMVLVASKLIHHFCTGMSVTIMFTHLPNVDRILQLCYDIYLVRENREWYLEEDLYAKLLFLYRCPELLIKWSQPTVEAINAPSNQTTDLPRTDQSDEETVE
ncbi:hypothetical protein J437_LFUL003276 [Ladona fulva]|uniref:Piezo non-specific cation channel cap domain-containing protein n=1 Tax=Ladona fulva TaxID=123851 RepID=A0A8K0NZZ4_LADFU|nr:hypothetical protein J437_LFUL003276 [Ladona fulva]